MWFSVISRRASLSFPRFRASCNVILVLFHVTDIACFYVKTIFVFQKMEHKQTNEQTSKQKFPVQPILLMLQACLIRNAMTLIKIYQIKAKVRLIHAKLILL